MIGSDRRHAFTLIELSISLIIIGLVVSGILIGRDLIRAAELRADISQIEKVNLSVQAFRAKYGCLPGDCADISQVLIGATNGDGNGRIATPGVPPDCTESAYISSEYAYAVDHLARAGMIDNVPFNVTNLAEAGAVGKGLIELGSTTRAGIAFGCGYTDPVYCAGGGPITYQCSFIGLGMANKSSIYLGPEGIYKPAEAYQIDSKIDDGLPYSGTVMPMLDYGSDGVLFPAEPEGTDICGSSFDGLPYNMRRTAAQSTVYSERYICSLRIKASF